MATLATLIDWITSTAKAEEAAAAGVRLAEEGEFELRPLPNEDIYLWVRDVDNSRVIPKTDPQSTRAAVRFIGSACLAALLLAGVLVPVGSNILAGYQLHELKKEREFLAREAAELELKEAELLNPARLATLAEYQQLVDPAPETAVPLAPRNDAALALNRR